MKVKGFTVEMTGTRIKDGQIVTAGGEYPDDELQAVIASLTPIFDFTKPITIRITSL